MTPYSEQPTVNILYKLFSNQPYKATESFVLPAGQFELNPLYQFKKQNFALDPELVVEEKLFILSGPEYN